MRSCQYCHLPVTNYRMTVMKGNIGGECVTAIGSKRAAGIVSIYRYHPIAVCGHHYHNLPKHVSHWSNHGLIFHRERDECRGLAHDEEDTDSAMWGSIFELQR